MPESCTHLYVHLVWATWDRQSLIHGTARKRLYAAVTQACRNLRCLPIAIGWMPDHVHLLVRLHARASVAVLAHDAKGMSSHLVRQSNPEFRWQGSYGAFSLRETDVAKVRAYVEQQVEHHTLGRLWPRAEQCDEEPGNAKQVAGGETPSRNFDNSPVDRPNAGDGPGG